MFTRVCSVCVSIKLPVTYISWTIPLPPLATTPQGVEILGTHEPGPRALSWAHVVLHVVCPKDVAPRVANEATLVAASL